MALEGGRGIPVWMVAAGKAVSWEGLGHLRVRRELHVHSHHPLPPCRLGPGSQCRSTLSRSPKVGPGVPGRVAGRSLQTCLGPLGGVPSGLTPQPEATICWTLWEEEMKPLLPGPQKCPSDLLPWGWGSAQGRPWSRAGYCLPFCRAEGRAGGPYSNVEAHLLPVSSSRGA